MSRVFIDGFEHNSLNLWIPYNSPTITTGLIGNYAAYLSGGNYRWIFRDFGITLSEIYIAFKIKFTGGIDPIIYLRDSSNNYIFGIRGNSGYLKLYRGYYTGTVLATGTKVITTNNIYLIEIYYLPRNTSGSIVVKIDGVEDVSYSGDSTNGLENIRSMQFGCGSQITTGIIDDVIVDDSDWIGNTKIRGLAISGVGNSSQWTPLSGNNYENVDEVPYNDSDYNYTNSVGNIDTYALNNIDWDVYSIKCIQIHCRIGYEGNPTPTHIQLVTRVNGTDYFSSDFDPSTSYNNVINVWDLNPDDSQIWEEADINALEIGIKATA